MQTLDKYISLREKYSDILYDESASPDEITETYNSLEQLQSKAKAIISNAINYTYGERIQEYKKMKSNMTESIYFDSRNTVGVKGFSINKKHYNILIPEKKDWTPMYLRWNVIPILNVSDSWTLWNQEYIRKNVKKLVFKFTRPLGP